jgi:hypothetical protein
MSRSLTERYDERIAGVLSCYDRLVVTGTMPGVCFAEGMTRYLHAHSIPIFDYPAFASRLRDSLRERAAALAAEAGVTIEFVAKSHIRKEDIVTRVLKRRGDHPGLVHVISAMETCDSYRPWHDKATHRNLVKPAGGKCLHYYFYFIDAELGLIYLRVPTWAPFRLQFYCNGHSWLACQLSAEGIGYSMPSFGSTTGSGRKTWPMRSRRTGCTVLWTVMPSSAVRCPRRSSRAITGASCRSNMPPT